MRRRDFISFVLGAAAAWPRAARAQQGAPPVIGALFAGAPEQTAAWLAAFRNGLSETGYVEGGNVAIEYRWANNDADRLPELAADLVRRRVAVLVAPSDNAAARAAKAATATIPIVFGTAVDPVQIGLVDSLNRPGANVTGVTTMNAELAAKRVGLLRELLPDATHFAALVMSGSRTAASVAEEMRAAVSKIGGHIEVLAVGSNAEIDAAFANFLEKRIQGLLISPETLFVNRLLQIVTLATRHAVPAIYPARFWAEAGGLMSYGSSFTELHRQAGIYTGRVLKGEKPADIPVLRASKFELVLNLITAKAFGLTVPATLLAAADEVIE